MGVWIEVAGKLGIQDTDGQAMMCQMWAMALQISGYAVTVVEKLAMI